MAEGGLLRLEQWVTLVSADTGDGNEISELGKQGGPMHPCPYCGKDNPACMKKRMEKAIHTLPANPESM